MSIKAGRFFTAALVLSLLIQTQIAGYGYAAGRPKIVFSSTRDGNSEIYVMESDGSNQVRLTNDQANDTEPSWSPDGERIAFVSDRNNKADYLYVMDSDGGNLKRLTSDAVSRDPAWSPDGQKILYVRSKGGYQLWVMDADGGNRKPLTRAGMNVHPSWSPDGARIAFTSFKGGVPEIYVMDANGENQQRLTQHKAVTGHPSWSPDGQWIAYESQDRVGHFQIFAVRTDGSGIPKMLTHNLPSKWRPAWSPRRQHDCLYVSRGLSHSNRDDPLDDRRRKTSPTTQRRAQWFGYRSRLVRSGRMVGVPRRELRHHLGQD